MAKKKNWTYAEATITRLGLMRCCGCNKHIISGEFRFYETEHAYVTQCPECGKGPEWDLRDLANQRRANEQWEKDSDTSPKVLLERIRDSFSEGFQNANTGDWDEQEAWEGSEAKRVHDALAKLWSQQ